MTNPPQDYRVELEAYSGPLDLLLYLVKRHEIDLHDIPIAALTDQYMKHLAVIREIDVDRAGEFLVMAATLLEVKSQVITPRSEQEEGEEDATDAIEEDTTDPRYELVQQLLAYKRYKDAAIELEQRQDTWSGRYAVSMKAGKPEPTPEDEAAAKQKDMDLEDLDVMVLCEAFANILDSIGQRRDHQVTYDDTPISLHADDIADRLRRDGAMSLQQIFVGRSGRSEMIGLFLAMLELVKQRTVKVQLDKETGEIKMEYVPEDERGPALEQDDAQPDWRNPETGEVEYDWPDEAGRKRAERRERLRKKRAEKGEFGKGDEDADLDEDDIDDEDLEDEDLDEEDDDLLDEDDEDQDDVEDEDLDEDEEEDERG